jgi:hypothetical protein
MNYVNELCNLHDYIGRQYKYALTDETQEEETK